MDDSRSQNLKYFTCMKQVVNFLRISIKVRCMRNWQRNQKRNWIKLVRLNASWKARKLCGKMLCLWVLCYSCSKLQNADKFLLFRSNRHDSIVIKVRSLHVLRNDERPRRNSIARIFFSFAFKILRFYETRRARELIRCVYHVRRWFAIQHPHHGIGEKR